MKLFSWSGVSRFAVIAVAVLLLAAPPTETGVSYASAAVAPTAVQSAPMITVTDITGREFSLADNVAKQRPTVVYFMASWCPICAMNWKGLNEVVPKYEGKVDFIAISIDPTDTVDILEKLAVRENFKFRTSPGNIDAMLQFGVTAQTAKFAIDGNGNIVYRHDGALTSAEWEAVFAQLANG